METTCFIIIFERKRKSIPRSMRFGMIKFERPVGDQLVGENTGVALTDTHDESFLNDKLQVLPQQPRVARMIILLNRC